MINERYCVLDIETWTPTGKPDPEMDNLRYVGFKDGGTGRKICLHFSEKEKIQEIIDFYDYFVGHNIINYDIPVLENHGYSFKKHKFTPYKIPIDTYQIMERRAKSMMYLDLLMGEKSLSALCERFELTHKKGEYDYSKLEPEQMSPENEAELKVYLEGDLDASDELFQYLYSLFFGIRQFMSDKDQMTVKWLTSSAGTTAYKCICNMADLKQEYDDTAEMAARMYEGAFVSVPYLEKISGYIYCIDFASLYPHMMMGGNLYSPCQQWETYWQGSGMFASKYQNEEDGIRGKYSRTPGKIEKVISNLYSQRVAAKMANNDELSLATKILINTIYGIMGSPKFKSIASIQGAADCTGMARRAIKHARTILEDNGYECIYTDTDSVYVLDKHNDFSRLKDICDEISQLQIDSMNIPTHTHNFEIEDKIKQMYFFKDDKGEFIKKNYIYITDEDKVTVKGLKIVKGNTSPVAKEFYSRWIKPSILDGSYETWTPEDMLIKMKILAKEDSNKFVKRYRPKAPETYKVPEGKEEATSIQYAIAKKYGAGEHWLVVNKHIGVGKGYRYCKIEELVEKYGETWVDHVCFESYMKDLSEFINWENRKKIKDVDRRKM